MSPEVLGIVIGGLIPAVLYAVSALFTKAGVQAGIGLGIYMLVMGLAVMLVGLVFFIFVPDKTLSARSVLHTMGAGVTWGLGAGLVALAIAQFSTPLGKLVPLYNMNTLIAVLLALWIFSEWKQVNSVQLLIGSALIVVGGVLVTRA